MPRRLLALVLICLLVGGCSGSSPAGAVLEPEDERPSGTEADASEPELAKDGQLAAIVRLALIEPETLDPARVSLVDQSAVVVSDLLYDGLTEAVGRDGVLRPGLAAKWAPDHDFLRWSFRLDPERGVTAAEVVASFERLRNVAGSGTVRAAVDRIAQVKAADEETVVIQLTEPDAGFAWIVSGLPFSIVGNDEAPTGRYRETAPAGEARLNLQADGLPDVSVRWVADRQAAYAELVSGQVDAALVGGDSIADASERFGSVFPERSITEFYVVNLLGEGLDTSAKRANLLAALGHASQDATFVSATEAEISGIVSPALAGFGGNGFDRPRPSGTAGSGDGAPFAVAYLGPDSEPLASRFVADLVSAGVSAETVQVNAEDLAAAIVESSVDLFPFGWVAPAGSVDAVVPLLLRPATGINVARVDSTRVAGLLSEAAKTGDDLARWALYAQAHDLVLEDQLILPLVAVRSHLAQAGHAGLLTPRADGSLDMIALHAALS